MTANNLIKVGELKKPYGIQGWLWLFSYMEDREAIFDIKPWVIKTAMGRKNPNRQKLANPRQRLCGTAKRSARPQYRRNHVWGDALGEQRQLV